MKKFGGRNGNQEGTRNPKKKEDLGTSVIIRLEVNTTQINGAFTRNPNI